MPDPSLHELTQSMALALDEARLAFDADEVPVGAVVLRRGDSGIELISRAHNQVRRLQDPSAHAEVLAIRAAARALGNERLTDCWLVVTLEPCVMCVGASVQARLAGIAYGAHEPKSGACGSAFDLLSDPAHMHQLKRLHGLHAEASRDLLQAFFRSKR
jgi:tRNA(adenine34) deaminase